MNFTKIVSVLIMGVCIAGCTAQEQALVKDVSGVVCAIVVQATNPALAPLCTTMDELNEIIDELINNYMKTHPSLTKEQAKSVYKPSQNDIYFALAKKRAAKK